MAELIEELLIRFPATSGYLAVCRLNATAVAAAADFDVEELDDLRLAVDEAVTWLVADGRDDDVELVLTSRPGELTLTGRRTAPGLPPRELDDLQQAILGATVDRFEIGHDDDDHRFIGLTKRTNSTAGP